MTIVNHEQEDGDSQPAEASSLVHALRPGRPEAIRDVNRTLVLEAIRRARSISRADLVRQTSISGPTVSAIVAELTAERLVREVGVGASGGGRRPRMVALDESISFVGCDLSSALTMRLGLVNMAQETVRSDTVAYTRRTSSPAQIAQRIAAYIAEVRSSANAPDVRGVGVGVPGVTDSAAGLIRWTPTLGWRDVGFGDLLSHALELPVVIDNDVNLALVGEAAQGAAQRNEHAVLIAFSEGVGGAILIGRTLYRGRAAAGEVGALVTGTARVGEDLEVFGYTERRIAEVLLQECTRRGVRTDGLERETQMLAGHLTDAAGRLDLSAGARRRLTHLVAAAAASVAAVLDPETIVLSGWIEGLGVDWLSLVQDEIGDLLPSPPPIRFSKLGSNAVVLGAGLMASHAAIGRTHLIG